MSRLFLSSIIAASGASQTPMTMPAPKDNP